MRGATKPQRMTRDVDFDERNDAEAPIVARQVIGSLAPVSISVETTRSPVLHAAQHVINDLSHDLRQPISSMTMNMQTALRCLRSPQPRVSDALEALTECLDTEREIVQLLRAAQRRVDDDIEFIIQCAHGGEQGSSDWADPLEAAPATGDVVVSLQARAARCRLVMRSDDGE
jgi:hypothetical protein